jgi:Fur family zinc uptake transcriptional regulator
VAAAAELCKARGVRLTALRRRVLELVWRGHRPVGAYEILKRLGGEERAAAPPTVYRALDFLLGQGLVHRIESRNAFIGCADPGASHSGQFLICDRCGNTLELDDDDIAGSVRRSAEQLGFRVAGQLVEVQGLCPACG